MRNARSSYSQTVPTNQPLGLPQDCDSTTIQSPPSAMTPAWPCAKTQAKLLWKHYGQCLLRPVTADQSEQNGLFGRGTLKRHALKWTLDRM